MISLSTPPDNTWNIYWSWIDDIQLYFTCELRETIGKLIWWTRICICYSSLSKESILSNSYSVCLTISTPISPVIIETDWTRKEPCSIFLIKKIWSRWYIGSGITTTNTAAIVIFYRPAICFIARKSEPVCISPIYDSFYSFSSKVCCLYSIFCIFCERSCWHHYWKNRSYSESHNRHHDGEFKHCCTWFIVSLHQKLHFLILLRW